jgi:hypothetical protein
MVLKGDLSEGGGVHTCAVMWRGSGRVALDSPNQYDRFPPFILYFKRDRRRRRACKRKYGPLDTRHLHIQGDAHGKKEKGSTRGQRRVQRC